ncbi:hypothetical protein SAMN00768000_3641 [Sulfobacillus thermosulfidooxidans DSM 9293]|uniref:Uncharacterized protein n=2 Tax=Sulfobacillus thermosulfidooxidans TaxID=28034 RepID=A0A1W1WP52_SULTA|nr:hypothetical protein [Sulfobacillus thermosulfidooxidans]PSR21014.1 MAG: hypothetical protein C7B47_17580 [Sulfobacillus thermosulfidooxidans]SMC08087.1 hypothetical protein SAMN00768000_3641 [Sulfobacillus thermosulfidooxidans DSM 9293]
MKTRFPDSQESALYRLEITYLDAQNRPVNRGQAVAVRRRVIDGQGRIVTEKIRHKISRIR